MEFRDLSRTKVLRGFDGPSVEPETLAIPETFEYTFDSTVRSTESFDENETLEHDIFLQSL